MRNIWKGFILFMLGPNSALLLLSGYSMLMAHSIDEHDWAWFSFDFAVTALLIFNLWDRDYWNSVGRGDGE